MHLLALLGLFTDRKTDFSTFHIRQLVESLPFHTDVTQEKGTLSGGAFSYSPLLGVSPGSSVNKAYQVPVVQKLGYFIQRVNHYPTDKLSIRETDCVIRWIEIYLVDSVIDLLNNWAGLSLQETRTEKEEQIDVLGEDFFITIRN